MPNAIFCCPDLGSVCLQDHLGLAVTGQQIHDDHAVLACRVAPLSPTLSTRGYKV